MSQTLTNTQLELLRIFKHESSEEEMQKLRQYLSEMLAKRLTDAVDQEAKEKGYTKEIIDGWKNEHFRTPYNR